MDTKFFIHFRVLLSCLALFISLGSYGQPGLYDIHPQNGKYAFHYNELPDPIISVNVSANANTTFMWQFCNTPQGTFQNLNPVVTTANYTPPILVNTIYYRRLATNNGIQYTSNTVRIEVVSINWEDLNYVREHTVLKPAQTTWKQVDQLAIGDKLQNTTYFDGLGRAVQQVGRETATPAIGTSVWGDMVLPMAYDNFGRQDKSYLTYTTTTLAGKFKTGAVAAQATYYTNVFQDSKPYSTTQFEETPLNRVLNQKAPGDPWNNGIGNSATLQINTLADDVKRFTIGYLPTDKPVLAPQANYAANTLTKQISTDELGKKVITFVDGAGRLILKKVELADNPSATYTGWICTYYVYDDLGQLRVEVPAEAVAWLNGQNWNFAAPGGQAVFDNYCFVFFYDEKGRAVYKKSPGVQPLYMLYDERNRLVMTQDGNQREKTPLKEWGLNLYDDLDRLTVTALYYSNLDAAGLQTIINASTNTVPGYLSPISVSDYNNSAICTRLSYQYYDDYTFSGAAAFATADATAVTAITAPANSLAVQATARTRGMATGSSVRVLGTETLLTSTVFYDEYGNAIQTHAAHIKQGVDRQTNRYHWDGRLVASYSVHSMNGHAMHNFATSTHFTFDKIGRVTHTHKKWGSAPVRVTASYAFNDLGRLINKRLSPNYTGHFAGIGPAGGGLENLAYTYNIQGGLIGVNKAYALKESGYNKWGNFFGMYLAYATNEAQAGQTRLNGQMAAQVWNTQGDDMQRRYNYHYDAAGRLTEALFAQRISIVQNWEGTTLNFHEAGTGGKIQYDLNGNITSLIRHGYQLGNSAIVQVDNLQYEYEANSNKLKKVTDLTANPGNGTAGDFKDGSNGLANDYVYDDNGNLITDLNKDIKNLVGTNGIRYNHLDKPEEIKIEGKGTIKITYDARGAKLKREFISATGGGTKITWYVGAYQYEEVTGGSNPQAFDLSFIGFGEGRIRAITAVSTSNSYDALYKDALLSLPGGKKGSIDYFITDHRSDTRMILTEETQWSYTTASMETASGRRNVEVNLFGNDIQNTALDINMIPGQTSGGGWQANGSAFVSKLGGIGGTKIGPNQLLKVMAGDQLTTTVKYYFENTTTPATGSYLAADVANIIGMLILNNPGSSDALKAGVPGIQQQMVQPPFNYWLQYNSDNGIVNNPKANLSILFFDERFNFVPESSQQVRVATPGNGVAPLVLSNIKAPKNGYCFIYISNEASEPVYFDDLQVRHDRGRILEENHYYATGLKIAPLSSKAFGGVPNNYQYQGDYSEFDDDLGWNDFMLRSYDAQIGRFLQHDPYDQFASGYVGMGNDFGNMVDPTGGWGTGVGCAAVAGMSGYGGMAGRISGASNMVSVISTVATVGSMAMRGGGIVGRAIQQSGSITQSLQFGGGSESSSGHGPSADEGGGSGEEDAGNGCKCPKGYQTNPDANTEPHPYYQNIDDVARYFAIHFARKNPDKEHSSLIYLRIEHPKNETEVRLYTITDFHPGKLRSSPGPEELLKFLPKGKDIYAVGHIHHHPSYVDVKYTHMDNEGFSTDDNNNEKGILGTNFIFPSFTYYVLGSRGALWKQWPQNAKQMPKTGRVTGGSTNRLDENKAYDKSMPAGTLPPPCPCYRIRK